MPKPIGLRIMLKILCSGHVWCHRKQYHSSLTPQISAVYCCFSAHYFSYTSHSMFPSINSEFMSRHGVISFASGTQGCFATVTICLPFRCLLNRTDRREKNTADDNCLSVAMALQGKWWLPIAWQHRHHIHHNPRDQQCRDGRKHTVGTPKAIPGAIYMLFTQIS